ncbi:hypothetical protein D9758_014547 [Tetrapyrgos nigripes]|uniref:MYND-type domain-containing protein n=1 Tax=Tetrapyrgos nigripes TaxID=182062 RepID=A0A8H5CEZ6_9AGAR|nr:hypothetical protein D9758_014547 [Tetrapyrgos nigripes]
MEGLASAFSGLPYFSPMMMVNRSETCATRRLSQCWGLGVYTNDVTPKFQGNPENATDLSRGDFFARKAIIEEVEQRCEEMKNEGKANHEWVPILYLYEIVKSSAKRERDWGHLVFTDLTLTRFLIVMIFPAACDCGNYSHHDYDALTRYQADRFMSLLHYLKYEWSESENQPNWVRATYTTPDQAFKLNPELFDFASRSTLSANSNSTALAKGKTKLPPIFHVIADNFIPTLLDSELEKIDNVVAQGMRKKRAEPSTRDRVLVVNPKEGKPNVNSKVWKNKNPRQCSFCEKVSKDKDLQKCSRCKLVFYCGKECQRMAWPSHKFFCKSVTQTA